MTSDVHTLSGVYAVDALDDLERAGFEAHLDSCPDCRAEVQSLREAACLLGAASAADPPAALRADLLEGIRSVRPLPPASRHATSSPAQASATRRWVPMLVAAAVLAVLGVAAAVVQPWRDDPAPTLSTTERVLQAPDAERVVLEVGEARATLVRSRSEGRAVLVTEDMEDAPAGQDFELWLQSPEGEMVPAGLMPDGADQTILLEGDATDAVGAGITLEPDGGSAEPTLPPVALFELPGEA